MKKKRMAILVLQVVVILLSVFLLSTYVKNQIKPTKVYVYTRNISDVTEPLKEKDIKEVTIPKQAVNKDFALNKDEIIGMCISSEVKSGHYVYKNQLNKTKDIDVFKALDLSKYRKISLPTTFVDSLAGNIKKGDKVDLIYTSSGVKVDESDSGSGENFNYSKVFMQNVPVYSIDSSQDQQYEGDLEIENEEDEEKKVSPDKSKIESITLVVTLEQAEEIETRVNTGKVRFLGRFNDSKSYNTLGYVLGDYEKIFSGQGLAETDRNLIEEDDFDEYILEDIEE